MSSTKLLFLLAALCAALVLVPIATAAPYEAVDGAEAVGQPAPVAVPAPEVTTVAAPEVAPVTEDKPAGENSAADPAGAVVASTSPKAEAPAASTLAPTTVPSTTAQEEHKVVYEHHKNSATSFASAALANCLLIGLISKILV